MLKLNEFKEKLNSVVFMGIGSFLAIIALFLMFAPAVEVPGQIFSSTEAFWNNVGGIYWSHGAWPSFVGYMLILVGALIMGIIALPIVSISSKLEKICLFTAIGSLVVGAILVMCITPILIGVNASAIPSMFQTKAGPIVSGVFALLAAGCAGVAIAFDW